MKIRVREGRACNDGCPLPMGWLKAFYAQKQPDLLIGDTLIDYEILSWYRDQSARWIRFYVPPQERTIEGELRQRPTTFQDSEWYRDLLSPEMLKVSCFYVDSVVTPDRSENHATWRPSFIRPIFVGRYRAEYLVAGWIKAPGHDRGLWAAAQLGLSLDSPVVDAWLLISNMQPMGQKIGSVTFKKLTVTTDDEHMIQFYSDRWIANYSFGYRGPKGIELVRRGPEGLAFLEDAGAALLRLAISPKDPASFSNINPAAFPSPAIFLEPWTIKGWHETDGLLAPPPREQPAYTPVLPVTTGFWVIADDSQYSLPRWRCRFHQPVSTHQGGAPIRKYLFDLPQLLGGAAATQAFEDLLLLAADATERPVQRSHPSLDGKEWETWRFNIDHDDRYEEGGVNMRNEFTSKPNPDFDSMKAAKDKRRIYGLNGMDHEHLNLFGLPQAYLRTGCRFFQNAIVGRAECARSIPEFSLGAPWHSERTGAWLMNLARNAGYVDNRVMADAWHTRAVKVMTQGMALAGKIFGVPNPVFPSPIEKPLFGWFRGKQNAYCAPWMGGLLLQACAALCYDEVQRRQAGCVPIDLPDIKRIFLDTLRFYKATAMAPDGDGMAYKVSPYAPYTIEGGYQWNGSRTWLACGIGALLMLGNEEGFEEILPWAKEVLYKLVQGHEHDTHGRTYANIWFQSARLALLKHGQADTQPG